MGKVANIRFSIEHRHVFIPLFERGSEGDFFLLFDQQRNPPHPSFTKGGGKTVSTRASS